MWISKRALVAVAAAAIGALSMALAAGAFGAPGKQPRDPSHLGRHTGAPLINESLAPSHNTPPDPTFHGVVPGSLPWVLKRGQVLLKRDGKLDLHVKGLVIPPPMGMNTPGPVAKISASLYCGDNLNTTAADTTQQVPISSKGNARIHDTSFSVPPTCLAPVILVHPTLNTGVELTGVYIALDGWRP